MKKILFLLLAFALTMPVCAQTDDNDIFFGSGIGKEKKSALYLGPKIGVGLTSISDPSEGKLGDKMGTGLIGGVAMNLRFGKATESSPAATGWWGVGLELRYKNNVAKTVATSYDKNLNKSDENANLSLSYFEIPLFLHVYPFAKSSSMNSLYVEAGVSLGTLLSRGTNYLYVQNPSANYSEVLYCIDADESKLKGGDIHPILGLGYTIPRTGLDINVRYDIGATKLAKNFSSKMSTIEVSLAYNFKICKF